MIKLDEIWLPIAIDDEIYTGYYEVSGSGDIFSIRRDRLLKPAIGSSGYLSLSLSCPIKSRTYRIHNIVAETFLGKKPGGLEVNHKDGNKLNNSYDNLEYITRKENLKHASRLGLIRHAKGENNHSKLTEIQVLEIRSKYIPHKYSFGMLATEYKVARSTISDIIIRKAWKHL